jgi:hypothetical protein
MNAIDPGLSDLPGPRCRQILDLCRPIPLVDGIPVYPIFGSQLVGGRMGIHAATDVLSANTLVSQLADRLSLDELWLKFSEILSYWNTERLSISDLLSFRATLAGEAVPQSVSIGPFEHATEYGISVAQGPPIEALVLGYDRHDWDKRASFTWKFLRDAQLIRSGRCLKSSCMRMRGWSPVACCVGFWTRPPPTTKQVGAATVCVSRRYGAPAVRRQQLRRHQVDVHPVRSRRDRQR